MNNQENSDEATSGTDGSESSDESSIEISEEIENDIWRDLQLTKEIQKIERKYSSGSLNGNILDSPLDLTPPPIKSLADLRNNFSSLSLAGPCPDCENADAKIERLKGFLLATGRQLHNNLFRSNEEVSSEMG